MKRTFKLGDTLFVKGGMGDGFIRGFELILNGRVIGEINDIGPKGSGNEKAGRKHAMNILNPHPAS